MGGEGAMIAASNSLKNNRNLVSKRKDKKALEGSYANARMKTFPKATNGDLLRIREKLKKERRRDTVKQNIVVVLFLVSVLLSVFLIIK
ncbi:hypothetical protein [Aestuariibaculum marinum]|uniref:Uncharacterized protein n=1 Tax=Aestuariibaculum marinum TaxID=2683592 RepID=A0A8J6U7H7_9FLAO|nr:hypothetical protein [Aestuariibaculum marinum]MBD0825254.1 hypothetical protein [Aestuariibaculum marinum]